LSISYSLVEVFTSEDVRVHGKPIWGAVVDCVSKSSIAARCIVMKGFAGCYESGEVAADNIEILSYNMPVKIEIILPTAELDIILPSIEEMVVDGIVAVAGRDVYLHRSQRQLIPRQMKVRDAMTCEFETVYEGTPVSDVIRLLMTNDYNAVPVVDLTNHPIGMITQSDLISRAQMPVRLGLLPKFDNDQVEGYLKSVSRLGAGDVMTKPVITVSEDKRLTEAVDIMLSNHLKRLPVVNEDDEMVGILARVDVFRVITITSSAHQSVNSPIAATGDDLNVGSIMRRDIQTVNLDTSIEDVLRVIDKSDIQRVAVVDGEGRLAGMIFDADLLGLFADHTIGMWESVMRRIPFTLTAAKYAESRKVKTAADVMRVDMITVTEDTPTEEAVVIMTEKGIKRLPVVDKDGVFLGMISRDSLLRSAIRSVF